MEISRIAESFGLGSPSELTELNGGHINKTYLAECPEGLYIMQSVNSSVFADPEAVMHNISALTALFSNQENAYIRLPEYLCAGDKLWTEIDGFIWRVYSYAESKAPEMPCSRAWIAGRSFGEFMRIAGSRKLKLKCTVPGYHDFDAYFSRLNGAMTSVSMKKIDGAVINRLSSLNGTLSNIFTGDFPRRVIHGDAKTDNVIICDMPVIIDLDTIMDGYAALDYGDLVRSVCRGTEPDMQLIRDVTRGFAAGLDGVLSSDEVHSLYYGILWSTGELAVRYLIDHLTQERYFRDKTPAECLSRANELLHQLNRFIVMGDEITELIYECFRKK